MGFSVFTTPTELQTTDATPSPAGSFAMPADSMAIVDIKVKARAADGTSAEFIHQATLDRVGLAVPALVNTIENTIKDLGAAAWSLSVSADSSGNVTITVTGQAATLINWRFDGNIEFFKP